MKEVKADIISGFLGAGKTTFLNKVLPCLKGNNVLIENEFGDISLDGQVLKGEIPVKEIYAGCICCSLAMDFKTSIIELTEKYDTERIIVEPSGVGRLTDIIDACEKVNGEGKVNLVIDRVITIVDLSEFSDYADSFGAFYLDQIQRANIIFFSHMDKVSGEELQEAIDKIKEINPEGVIFEEDWFSYDGEKLLDILESIDFNKKDKDAAGERIVPAHVHFGSFSTARPADMDVNTIKETVENLEKGDCGRILRIKGVLKTTEGERIHVDYTPGNLSVIPETTDMSCCITVIGCDLNKESLRKQFERRYTKWRKL